MLSILPDSSKTPLTDALGMTNDELDVWKEEVQMDAIQGPNHAHRWFSGDQFD